MNLSPFTSEFIRRRGWKTKYPYPCLAPNTKENIDLSVEGASVVVERTSRIYAFKTAEARRSFMRQAPDSFLCDWQ